jgi:hypothetical protein
MGLLNLWAQPGAVSLLEFLGYVIVVDRHKWLYPCKPSVSSGRLLAQIEKTELKGLLVLQGGICGGRRWPHINRTKKAYIPFCSMPLMRLL